MLALGWGLAAALGAVSGMLTAPALGSFDQNLMQPVLLYAFAGGRSRRDREARSGPSSAALLLGVFVNLIGTYVDWIGTDLRLPVALRSSSASCSSVPSGLFGRASARTGVMRRALGIGAVAGARSPPASPVFLLLPDFVSDFHRATSRRPASSSSRSSGSTWSPATRARSRSATAP